MQTLGVGDGSTRLGIVEGVRMVLIIVGFYSLPQPGAYVVRIFWVYVPERIERNTPCLLLSGQSRWFGETGRKICRIAGLILQPVNVTVLVWAGSIFEKKMMSEFGQSLQQAPNGSCLQCHCHVLA